MAKIPKEVEEIKEINRNRFHIEEYKALRREIEIYLHESRFQERYTIVASGLIWAWLITHRIDNGWVWSLPVWIALASSIRRLAITGHFNVMREYLKGVENFYGVKGWEHRNENWNQNIAYSELIISAILFVLSFAAWYWRAKLILH